MLSVSKLTYEVLEKSYLGVDSNDIVVNPKSSAYVGRKIILTVSDERFSQEFLRDLSSRNHVISRLKIYETETVKYVPYDNSVNFNIIPIICEDVELILSNMSVGKTIILSDSPRIAIPKCLILDKKVGNDLTIFGYIENQISGDILNEKLKNLQIV